MNPKYFFRRIWRIFYAPIILLAIHGILEFGFDLYNLLPWLDIPMHFLGGVTVAFAAKRLFDFFEEKQMLVIRSPWIFLLFTATFVSAIAVLWEFFEFGVEYFFHVKAQLSEADTMGDLFMGWLGAVTAGSVMLILHYLDQAYEKENHSGRI